jgi:Glycosyltransferase family 6
MEISLISIATNGYTKYWLQMINSMISNKQESTRIRIHILTDDPEFVRLNAPSHPSVGIMIHKIDSEPWPYPTLHRYKYINSIVDDLDTEYFMYLDADMKAHPGFDNNLKNLFETHEMNFVAHPGFWRDKQNLIFTSDFIGLRRHAGDLYRLLRFGGLGDWETRRKSTAFVPRKGRKLYICGGIWFGKVNRLRELVTTLETNVSTDSEAGLIAKWHDESHLNAWFVKNGGWVLSPEYCFDPTYPQLRHLRPLIEAVDKGNIERV